MTPDELKDLTILGRNIKWQYKLDDFTDSALFQMKKAINQAKKDIVRHAIKRGKKLGPYTRKRGEKIIKELDKLTLGIREKTTDSIADLASTAGVESLKEHADIISFGGKVGGVNTVSLSPMQLKSFIMTTALGGTATSKGRTLQNWVDAAFSRHTQKNMLTQLQAGVFKGEGYPMLVKRLERGFDTISRREAITLARTYVQSANITAQMETYKANPNVVKAVKWSAILEAGHRKSGRGTCLACSGLDGNIYSIVDTTGSVEIPKGKVKKKSKRKAPVRINPMTSIGNLSDCLI